MFCPYCGDENHDGASFCKNCGRSLTDDTRNQAQQSFDQGYQQNYGGNNQGYQYDNNVYSGSVVGDTSGIQQRSIALAIIFSIITCGIYGIYWFIVLTNEANQLSGRTEDTSGGLAFVLTLITCGIYGWFWAAKMGEKTDIINGTPNGNYNILFIILQIFGLGIINYALAQDAINRAVS